MRILILLLSFCQLAVAASVGFRVVDSSGTAAKGVLVIVQNLQDREAELLRALSNDDGIAGSLKLNPGLYRVIATTPYGIWQTTVKEFVVGAGPVIVTLPVRPMPTHGYGDIVILGSKLVPIQVVQSDGQAASGASLLVRDSEATLHTERWYKADAQGRTKIETVSDPLVIVIVYRDEVMTLQFPEKNTPPMIKFTPDAAN